MSKEERIQERVAEKLGFRVDEYGDAPTGGGAWRNPKLALRQLWDALIAAETKLEPQTANADVLADRHYIAGAKVGFSLGVEGNSKGLNKLIADRQREIGDYLREPQTVAEPIDWEKEFGEFVNRKPLKAQFE